jgi:hypothetical protein
MCKLFRVADDEQTLDPAVGHLTQQLQPGFLGRTVI